MKKACKVLLARFPGNFSEHPDSTDWIIQTYKKCLDDPRIEEVKHWRISDTPITMGRNRCIEVAKRIGTDYLLMIDSDMGPDQPGPTAKPFWETAFNFLFDREQPAIIAAPYCGGGSYHNNVFVFHWANFTNGHYPFKLEQFPREMAADRGGIEKVAALPTGLILIDMRILERMKFPYFYYEWMGENERCPCCQHLIPGLQDEKASTEDVTFTRDASLAWYDEPEAGCFVSWDSWASHIKLCHIGRPEKITNEYIGERFRQAVERNLFKDERLQEFNLDFPKVNPQGNGHPTNGQEDRFDKMELSRDGALVELNEDLYREALRARYPEFLKDRNEGI